MTPRLDVVPNGESKETWFPPFSLQLIPFRIIYHWYMNACSSCRLNKCFPVLFTVMSMCVSDIFSPQWATEQCELWDKLQELRTLRQLAPAQLMEEERNESTSGRMEDGARGGWGTGRNQSGHEIRFKRKNHIYLNAISLKCKQRAT